MENEVSELAALGLPAAYLAIALYFLFVIVGLVRRGREVSGPWWFLLRSFFPSWRFYHDIGHQPRLFFRTVSGEGEWSEWSMFVPRARFSPIDLFHNPVNNLELLHQTLVEHLSADIQELADVSKVEELVSYRLADRLVRELVSRREPHPSRYQFEIRLLAPCSQGDQAEKTLISPVMSWS